MAPSQANAKSIIGLRSIESSVPESAQRNLAYVLVQLEKKQQLINHVEWGNTRRSTHRACAYAHAAVGVTVAA